MFRWNNRIISVIVKVQTPYTGMLINGIDAMYAGLYGNFNILIFRQQEKWGNLKMVYTQDRKRIYKHYGIKDYENVPLRRNTDG